MLLEQQTSYQNHDMQLAIGVAALRIGASGRAAAYGKPDVSQKLVANPDFALDFCDCFWEG
jgi:hypothetical protein